MRRKIKIQKIKIKKTYQDLDAVGGGQLLLLLLLGLVALGTFGALAALARLLGRLARRLALLLTLEPLLALLGTRVLVLLRLLLLPPDALAL